MKTPGEYALLWANGMNWKELVHAIRREVAEDCDARNYDCDVVHEQEEK